jgi:Arc/MetJ-type ribon-helix-helix transcriptional regulator
MAKKTSSNASPLTFDLPVSLISKIGTAQSKLGLASTSEVVRVAIAKYNFDRYEPNVEEHRQISVRLPSDMKSLLSKQSKKKKVSVGELLRVAIEGLAVTGGPAKKTAKKSSRK